MKGRLLSAKEVNSLKEGDMVYIKPIIEGHETEEGKAKIVYNEDEIVCALPINAKNIEEEAWELEGYQNDDSQNWLAIYEWVEDKQEQHKKTNLNNTELKVGDYISFKLFKNAKGYFIGMINSISIEENTVWGYWSGETIKDLPKTIGEFNKIEKDKDMTWIELSNIINSIKKLNLIDDIKDSTQFTKENLKTGMWIETRAGKKSLILLNTENGDIHSGDEIWGCLSGFKDNLLHERVKDYDVVKVYQPFSNSDFYKVPNDNNSKIIWERKEEKPKNKIEQTVIRTFTYNNETITLVHKDNWTTVRLKDGTMAKSRCHPKDEFDRDKGLEIAYYRAKKKQIDKTIDRLISVEL
jgi:hypothetical protein